MSISIKTSTFRRWYFTISCVDELSNKLEFTNYFTASQMISSLKGSIGFKALQFSQDSKFVVRERYEIIMCEWLVKFVTMRGCWTSDCDITSMEPTKETNFKRVRHTRRMTASVYSLILSMLQLHASNLVLTWLAIPFNAIHEAPNPQSLVLWIQPSIPIFRRLENAVRVKVLYKRFHDGSMARLELSIEDCVAWET